MNENKINSSPFILSLPPFILIYSREFTFLFTHNRINVPMCGECVGEGFLSIIGQYLWGLKSTRPASQTLSLSLQINPVVR